MPTGSASRAPRVFFDPFRSGLAAIAGQLRMGGPAPWFLSDPTGVSGMGRVPARKGCQPLRAGGLDTVESKSVWQVSSLDRTRREWLTCQRLPDDRQRLFEAGASTWWSKTHADGAGRLIAGGKLRRRVDHHAACPRV